MLPYGLVKCILLKSGNAPNPIWMHAYSQESEYATIWNGRSILPKGWNARVGVGSTTLRIKKNIYLNQ